MQQKLAIILALAAAALFLANHQPSEDHYLIWKEQFGIQYTPQQDVFRKLIFLSNLALLNKHNSDPSQTYKMAINQFSGLTDDEFAEQYLNPKPRVNTQTHTDMEAVPINADIDWTTKGMVSPVKNQGSCGSCWAFSAVGVLESWALSKGQTVNLSEQQLVDCSRKYGNEGCNGGFNYQGLAYVKDHGITTSSAYPYTAKTGSCKGDGGSFKIASVPTAKGCSNIAVAIQSRPIGVSADATNWSRYGSGIFNNCKKNLNHDILLVGMTSSYYKIKNSWGPSWGENGFIRLAPGDTCGICDDKSPWVQ